jgi:hypothetical protein
VVQLQRYAKQQAVKQQQQWGASYEKAA